MDLLKWFKRKPPVVKDVVIIHKPIPKIERGLQNKGAFYDYIRKEKLFGPVFSSTEFKGIEEILKDCAKAEWPLSYTAYALATAYHETAHTMQPVKEYGGYKYYMHNYDVTGKNPERARRMGNVEVGDGAKYCGRGYVQLTWRNNYKKAGKELGIDLEAVPDLAMNPDIASDIMTKGMENGWFTNHRLSQYLARWGVSTREQYKNARRIINGTDKDDLIAGYAMEFQEALKLGRWV